MKKKLTRMSLLIVLSLINFSLVAQTPETTSINEEESKEVIQKVLKEQPGLQTLYDNSYGYVIFPKVTKAGVGIGGAVGKGLIFQNHQFVGLSKLKELNVGIQFGGQQYSQIIFLENKETYDKFMNGKLKLDAQASAVALKSGVAVNAKYADGVAVYFQTIAGLMYEASIGAQHFDNTEN